MEIDHFMEEIANQRDEILRAFIAKYGYEPDQLEQVIQQGTQPGQIIWYVRKKGER